MIRKVKQLLSLCIECIIALTGLYRHACTQAAQQQQQQLGGGDPDAQARAQAILRSLAGPPGAQRPGGGPGAPPGGLTEAQLAGLLAGNVDAAQLVNSIVNGGMLPGLVPPAPPRPANRCRCGCPARRRFFILIWTGPVCCASPAPDRRGPLRAGRPWEQYPRCCYFGHAQVFATLALRSALC